MSFEHPYLFLLLIVPFVLFAFLVLTNKEGIERVFSKKVLERIKVEGDGLSSRGRNALFFMAIFFMIVAMSEPCVKQEDKNITLSGLQIALALDISGSMRSKDRYPNRLEFAKSKIKEMIEQLPQDEMMLFTFSDGVYLVSPMSSDRDTLKSVVDGITSDFLGSSSNFTALANIAGPIFKGKKQKLAVIVSDGGDKNELKRFEEIIKKYNIRLYAILIGTKEGADILDKDGKPVIKDDKIVRSSVNEYLGKIAKESGGDYIIADYGSDDIKSLVGKIESQNRAYKSGTVVNIKQKKELFYYPLILSLFLLLGALISIPSKEQFIKSVKRIKNGK